MSATDQTLQSSQHSSSASTAPSETASVATGSSWLNGAALKQRATALLARGTAFYETSFVSGLLLTVSLYALGWFFLQDGMANLEAALYSLLVPLMTFVVLPVSVIPMLISYYSDRGTTKGWWMHALVVTAGILGVAVVASFLLKLVFAGHIETAFTEALFSEGRGAAALSEAEQQSYANFPLVLQHITTLTPTGLIACFLYVYAAARLGTKAS
jgi:hypothetical protein